MIYYSIIHKLELFFFDSNTLKVVKNVIDSFRFSQPSANVKWKNRKMKTIYPMAYFFCWGYKTKLTFSKMVKSFNRGHIGILLLFHQNTRFDNSYLNTEFDISIQFLQGKQFKWIVKSCFLGKIRQLSL